MNLKIAQVTKFMILPLLFIVITLWNIPHTIAGRYICEGLLLIAVIAYKPSWKTFFNTNKVLLLFFAYLFIQLVFFSTNYQLAFSNFRSEWMHFIIFSIIGAGTGLILGKSESTKLLLYFGIAFSIPLYIHLALSMLKGVELGAIPWGYWGISETHGDFAYTALEAAILFSSFYFYAANHKSYKNASILLIILCIASPFLAISRGGVSFVISGVLFVFIAHLLLRREGKVNIPKVLTQLLIVTIVVLGIFKLGVTVSPDRLGGTLSRLSAALQGGDSIDTYCNGIEQPEQKNRTKDVNTGPEIQQASNRVLDGETIRVTVAKLGFTLMFQHPMGINQSKQAYQSAMIEACKGDPKIVIANAHNGWIDTALAIGIPGALLLLIVLIQYARLGWNALKRSDASTPYGMALFASAIMWILRGLLDSTLRDQMLEMQAFIFALLLGIILAKTQDLRSKSIS